MDFEGRYKQLNDAQKAAVEAIDGPVMVIAGPGTGKTELLSMRVANILRKTDALPENILCLTYTESGATAMRKRLVEIIGKDAYKVAIHTFHSFGAEVINQNSEFFYNGAQFQAADDLVTYEVLNDIFAQLPLNHVFASQMNGEYTYRKDVKQVIEELKKAGLTPESLRAILAANQPAIEAAEALLAPVFDGRLAASMLAPLEQTFGALQKLPIEQPTPDIPAWLPLLTSSLETALAEAHNHPKTTPPIKEWRDAWLKKNTQKQFILKAGEQQAKLALVADVYEKYLAEMQRRERFDYDDMILQVVERLENVDELRYNLQEKYQYLLVDEFQDTNLAQLRIVRLLTDNPVNEGRPDVFIVGDPDQAIYSFQGADISNILTFEETYPTVQKIILTENYRSTQGILDGSRSIIVQSDERMAERNPELNQPLKAASEQVSAPELYELPSVSDEYAWIAGQIKARIDQGTAPADIAVLMLKHADLQHLLVHLSAQGVPVTYERKDNALALEPLRQLIAVARLICLLAKQELHEANALLPEILAHPAWGFSSQDIWHLSSLSHKEHRLWLDTMQILPEFELWRNWLLELVTTSEYQALEDIIDRILGIPSETTIQPAHTLYEYFFSEEALQAQPARYVECVDALNTIRQKLFEQRGDQTLTLHDFIAFVDLHEKANVTIPLTRQIGSDTAVHVMTAHKSKGLEFEHVYVVGVTEDKWRTSSGGRAKIGYPENLLLVRQDTSADERLRLFYVALTRAKRSLTVSYSVQGDGHKSTLPASFLAEWEATPIETEQTIAALTQQALVSWHNRINEPIQELREFLAPRLEQYRLTATDLTHFLDLSYGGPHEFVTKCLLRFPSAGGPSAKYGNAIHATLCYMHTEFRANQTLPSFDEALKHFKSELRAQWLTDDDFAKLYEKGSEELTAYLAHHGPQFSLSQHPELNLSYQDSQLGDVRLGGRLDLVDLDRENKTAIVIDYKTSKTETTWATNSRLHKYRQQLMFYKLLLENSRDYHDYKAVQGVIDFVKPLPSGEVVSLPLDFDPTELERFKRLVTAVWEHITSLTIPDTSGYSNDIKGTLAFEEDLIEGRV